MIVKTKSIQGRRELHFADFSELLADAEHVANSPCQTLGNWSVGQILDHLAKAAMAPFEGFGGLKAPWLARTFVMPFIKNSLLTKSMPAGFQLPRNATALVPADEIDPRAALEKLKGALGRFTTDMPHFPHPFLGKLALQEWVSLTLRHAEMHLSFLIPRR